MVPNKFNMIDLDGLDIIESQGVIVSGLYDKLVESIALCRYQCIYNWKFNSIPIPPTYVELDSKVDGVWINDGIVVSQDDTIHIYSIEPEPVLPVIQPIEIAENGTYSAQEGVDGYSPITVNVLSGEYVKVSVYNGLTTVYEEFFAARTDVLIDEYLFVGTEVRRLYIDGVLNNSVNIDYNDLPIVTTNISIRQLRGINSITKDGLDLKVFPGIFNATSGVVLTANSDVTVEYSGWSYRQCGRCTKTATLPDIQDAGIGRVWYTTPNNDQETLIPFVADQDFFVSGVAIGSSILTIKNYFAE